MRRSRARAATRRTRIRCLTPRPPRRAAVPAAMRRTSSRRRIPRRRRAETPPPMSSPTARVPVTCTAIRRSQRLPGVCPDRITEPRMRRSSVEVSRSGTFTVLLAALGVGVASAQISRGPQRLVDVIEVSDRDGQVDLTVVFSCSMRFVTSLPASEGQEVHIQLVPLSDCGVNPFGQIPSEIPPLSGGAGIITAARVESLAPGQITLTLNFKKSERFVLAQGVDPRGLRVRLVDHTRARGRVLVEPTDVVSNFAINLDSRPKPFTPEEIELAHQRLQAPVFVSEAAIEGEKWYRLRIGPIERRSDADKMLNRALPDYPRAWLAIGDDAVTSDFAAA